MTMCAQVEFAWSPRIAKPTMHEHDCAIRLMFFLEMDERWHLKVHGMIDQGEFRVPLNHIVRAGGFREPGHLHLHPGFCLGFRLGFCLGFCLGFRCGCCIRLDRCTAQE